jgi:SAM-dependent methyltransferase
MGKSDPHYFNFCNQHIKPQGETALLGFTNNNYFQGDLYDLSLNNWDINSEWKLTQRYDTIICTRCAYFSKDPQGFVELCHEHLKPKGKLFVDWGIGDHWRFPNYKVGWVKNGEHEWAYEKDNYLWSTIWDDSFVKDNEYQIFSQRIQKHNYQDTKKAIFDEVPKVINLKFIDMFFETKYNTLALWEDLPQLYILISGTKK